MKYEKSERVWITSEATLYYSYRILPFPFAADFTYVPDPYNFLQQNLPFEVYDA